MAAVPGSKPVPTELLIRQQDETDFAQFFWLNFVNEIVVRFLPARRYASAVFATATCPDVRPSVTRRYCAKTVHFRHKVTIGR